MPAVPSGSCGAAGVTVRTCVVVGLQEMSARQSNTPSAMPARASPAFRGPFKLCPAIVICFLSKPLSEKPANLPARTRLVDICGTICSCGHQLSNASSATPCSPRLIVANYARFQNHVNRKPARLGATSAYHVLFRILIISGPRAKSQPFPLPNGSGGGQSRKWVQGSGLVRRSIAEASQRTLYERVTWAGNVQILAKVFIRQYNFLARAIKSAKARQRKQDPVRRRSKLRSMRCVDSDRMRQTPATSSRNTWRQPGPPKYYLCG